MTELQEKLTALRGYLDIPGKERRLVDLDPLVNDPDLWNDPDRARQVTQESSRLRKVVDDYARLSDDVQGLAELLEMATPDEAAGLQADVDDATKRVDLLYRETLFQMPHSDSAAIITIKPGAGGTESQDWASMLYRMYTRFAERHGFGLDILDVTQAEDAGINEAEFIVRGERAFGLLRPEAGVHRLVRASPFDAQSRRHTSFASVDIVPEIEDDAEIVIDPNDIRVDVFRSGGHGGQGVNTTDSAVRVTYKPGTPEMIIISSQNTRSQIKNREAAMKVLRSRLYEIQERKRRDEELKARGQQLAIEWGSQIRSYVLDKQYVKDHRTGVMRHDPSLVLDGDLDEFVWAGLEWMAGQRATANADTDD
ncbi:MAG TPA: peptide chain release factor 2 [Deinococcales bacterium]|nr:peptide chain release factor 2 [Deinococcales bacterium]